MNKSINHIQWNKNGTRIIQYQNSKVRDKKKESYELFPNGTLKIKRLDRSDEGTYKVIMYNEDRKNGSDIRWELGLNLKKKFLGIVF